MTYLSAWPCTWAPSSGPWWKLSCHHRSPGSCIRSDQRKPGSAFTFGYEWWLFASGDALLYLLPRNLIASFVVQNATMGTWASIASRLRSMQQSWMQQIEWTAYWTVRILACCRNQATAMNAWSQPVRSVGPTFRILPFCFRRKSSRCFITDPYNFIFLFKI